jgi:hypothetical protein
MCREKKVPFQNRRQSTAMKERRLQKKLIFYLEK